MIGTHTMIKLFKSIFSCKSKEKPREDTLVRMSDWVRTALTYSQHNAPSICSSITRAQKNKQVQYGCLLEEVCELIETIQYHKGAVQDSTIALRRLRSLSDKLKQDDRLLVSFPAADNTEGRIELLDALTDIIQTACSVGVTNGVNVPEGCSRVADSNYSKFDKNGVPIFDENGKIAKNKSTYFEPILDDLIHNDYSTKPRAK